MVPKRAQSAQVTVIRMVARIHLRVDKCQELPKKNMTP